MEKAKILSLLKLMEEDYALSESDLAIMLEATEEEIHEAVSTLEDGGIICGYRTLIHWDKITENEVTALVELKVIPHGGEGYQKIAEHIKEYAQVKTLYLMSGAYDFLVIVTGKSLKEIAMFVSGKLASISEVQSTATHFILTKYKELGIDLDKRKVDKRMVITA